MLLTSLEKLNVLLPEISNNLYLSVYLRRGAAKEAKAHLSAREAANWNNHFDELENDGSSSVCFCAMNCDYGVGAKDVVALVAVLSLNFSPIQG